MEQIIEYWPLVELVVVVVVVVVVVDDDDGVGDDGDF